MLSLSPGHSGGAFARQSRRIAAAVALVLGASAAAPALADVRPRPRDLRRRAKEAPRERSDASTSTGAASTGGDATGLDPADPPELIAPPQPAEVAASSGGVAVLPGPQAVGVQTELPEASADADAAGLPATRPVDSGATSTVAALGLAVLALVVAGVALVARRRRR